MPEEKQKYNPKYIHRGREKETRSQKWICSDCKSLLGFTDGISVRIKYKDLYITIEGGRISMICRYCGTVNSMQDSEYTKFLAQRTKEHFEGRKKQ